MAAFISNLDGLPSGYINPGQSIQSRNFLIPKPYATVASAVLADSARIAQTSASVATREVTPVTTAELTNSNAPSSTESTFTPLSSASVAPSESASDAAGPMPRSTESSQEIPSSGLPQRVEETQNLAQEILDNPLSREIARIRNGLGAQDLSKKTESRRAEKTSTPDMASKSDESGAPSFKEISSSAHLTSQKKSFFRRHWKAIALVALVLAITLFAICSAAGVGQLQHMGNFHGVPVQHLIWKAVLSAYCFAGLGYAGLRCLDGSES